MSVVRVLGGEELEGPRRTHIPTWAWTDRWTGDTRGWGFHPSVLFSPSFFDRPLSLVQSHPSSRSFFCAPPHPRLYPFFPGIAYLLLFGSLTPFPTFGFRSFIFTLPSFFRSLPPLWVSVPASLSLCCPLSGSLTLSFWVSVPLALGF